MLEIGCSDGRNLATLRSQVAIEGFGIDPSAKAVEAGKASHADLHLSVGTSDELPYQEPFHLVFCGFFLYLVDRDLLPKVVMEVDRVVAEDGWLAILDFDPPTPRKRAYRHHQGIYSYKMQYEKLFLAYPDYTLAEKIPLSAQAGEFFAKEPSDRQSLCILKKSRSRGYMVEEDG